MQLILLVVKVLSTFKIWQIVRKVKYSVAYIFPDYMLSLNMLQFGLKLDENCVSSSLLKILTSEMKFC